MRKYMMWILAGVVVVGAVIWGPIVSNVEQAKYTVVTTSDNIEIRDYAPMLVAEVEVTGDRKESINQGFRLIADFIFGNNSAAQKVAMTTPVIQQPSEKIAMTAPVIQQGDGNTWKVRFVMPAEYTIDMLPKPNNKAVKIERIEGKRFAVIRFSGLAGNDSLKENTNLLNEYIDTNTLSTISTPVFAFFNPPWTVPFMRRNEVMIEIAK
jgi:hypothetical protein